MNCPKCNAQNISGSSFCIKCGTDLRVGNQTVQTVQPAASAVNNTVSSNPAVQQQVRVSNPQPTHVTQPTQNNEQYQTSNVVSTYSNVALNYIMYIIAILLKPIKSFDEESEKFNTPKTTIIFSLIVTAAMTVFNLLSTMLNSVRVTFYGETSWEWENLKELNYVELIGKNFLIYAGVLLAIAVVFYVASLILKKEVNFIKTLAIAATSVIPTVIAAMLISPILTLIWAPLGLIVSIAGFVYSIIILYELMNNEIQLEGDIKIYFNLVCFGILAVSGYYLYMELFMSSVAGDLEDIFNLFG